MSLSYMTTSAMSMLSNQRIIATTSSKYVSNFAVVKTRENDTSLAKVLLKTAQRVDIDLAADVESLGIFNDVSKMCDG